MVEAILVGLSLGLALSVLFGPVFFIIIDTALLEGRWQAVSISLGAVASDLMLILLAWWITHGLFELDIEDVIFKRIAGAIFIGFGVASIIKSPSQTKVKPSRFKAILKSFLLNTVNPSVLVFWLGTMAIAVQSYEGDMVLIGIQFTVVVITVFSIDLVKIQLAHKLKSLLSYKIIRWSGRVVGGLFVLFGLFLMLGL